jgi:acyl carrier protein
VEPEFTVLLRRFLRFADGQELTEESRLFDLGLDSMQSVELLFEIEDTYGVELPPELLVDATFETAGALWRAVSRVREAAAEPAS